MPAAVNNAAQLEQRLVLVAWFANTLGYENNAQMLRNFRNVGEGWGDNHNKTLELIRNSANASSISPAVWQTLEELDAEIRADWDEINRRRAHPLTLKYFQYLAALASALFLHRLAESADDFLAELNEFAAGKTQLPQFKDTKQLQKLAFWMATGSGKTLLLHLNYRQFGRRQHALFAPDNILLLTPNEELSRQHIAEMRDSGIPCFRHGENAGLLNTRHAAVRVIEITKLIPKNGKRKKGKGESVPTEEFSGRNLIFVDEGHKGAGGEAWFAVRDELAKDGFVFEYSATFGQALNAADRDSRTQEYARAIVFDYSYRYFYGDGCGKDFSVLNIGGQLDEKTQIDTLMLGNLLSFFEQRLVFDEYRRELAPYQVESPLLLMLGASVTGGKEDKKSENKKREQSDIINVIGFLHRVARNKDINGKRWLDKTAAKILAGKSGINDDNGKDLFTERFSHLREKFNDDMNALCARMRDKVFHTATPGPLRFCPLKQAKGEIALKVGDGNAPFGLVFIGDTKKLRELAAQYIDGLEIDEDAVQKPLFADVHHPASSVNLLIGAKKFMEGWSSWRVSGMGLLNVGRSEGAQIIQLFGRGIRLKGKNFSLKRSLALPNAANEKPPRLLPLLETLNIFAVRANFISQFRDYLKREGVSEKIAIPLPIKANKVFLKKKLLLPLFPDSVGFTAPVELAADDRITVTLNMETKTQAVNSSADGAVFQGGTNREKHCFNEENRTDLLDFDRLYYRLLDYKRQNERNNLIIHREKLKGVLERCAVSGDAGVLDTASLDARERLHNIAFAALRKYAERLYYAWQKEWESEGVTYDVLSDTRETGQAARDNFQDYEIRLSADKADMVARIRKLIKDTKRLLSEAGENMDLPRVHFDRLLSLPLLLKGNDDIEISPPGLEKSEESFVRGLRDYLRENPPAAGTEVFLLRNLGKGKGIGFYESEGFYPDFILWIKGDNQQRIIFIEPHGMLHAPSYDRDFKAKLWEKLNELSDKLAKKDRQWKNIRMDSFIISETHYAGLRPKYGNGKWKKEDFKNHHILFAEDDYFPDILDG